MPSNAPESSVLLHRINATPTTTPAALDVHSDSTTRAATAAATKHRKQPCPVTCPIPKTVSRHHTYSVSPSQCCSAVVQHIEAPVSTVWSIVRRFDNPQAYKHFVKSCHVIPGDGDVGTLREIQVISGLPAANSTEKLEMLDDESHVISFSVVGGDHRLANYRSVTTLHEEKPAADDGSSGTTVVVESYVVDVPPGNTREDTCMFVDTIVRCNLQSLAQLAVNLARNDNNNNNNNNNNKVASNTDTDTDSSSS